LTEVTAESVFEQRWALALVRKALDRLRIHQQEADKLEVFDTLEGFLPGGRHAFSYKEAAERLDVPVEKVKGLIFRLRRKFREMLRTEVAHTVSSPDEVADEIRHLIEVIGGGR
jgi:RNA polymerase sigma-70 factor (ECF subfamily)